MKKFRCIVTRQDEYIIEIDENKIDEKWMKDFRGYMYDFRTLKEHAEHIAQHRARFGEDFIEGYGYPLVNGEVPFGAKIRGEKALDGINIKIIDEDDYPEVDIFELR